MRLVATEACRRALNGEEFMRRIQRETGLRLDIIKPEEEAQLAVISCAPLVSPKTENLLVVDIGGGSTELVWIDISKVPKTRTRASDHAPAFRVQAGRVRRALPRKWSTGFRCRLGSRRCATSSTMSKTMRPALR